MSETESGAGPGEGAMSEKIRRVESLLSEQGLQAAWRQIDEYLRQNRSSLSWSEISAWSLLKHHFRNPKGDE